MNIPSNNDKPSSDDLSMSIGQEQFMFSEQLKPFDPNLNLIAEYSPPPESNADQTQQATAIDHLQTIASNFNHGTNQNSEIFFISSSDVPNNCISYNNVTLVPTIENDGNQLDQIADAIELVEQASAGIEDNDTHSFKYILSSAFQTGDIDNTPNNVLCNNSQTNSYIEQSSHMISTVPEINAGTLIGNRIATNENNEIQSNHHNVEQMQQNSISIELQTNNDQEVLLQDQNGQLYRHVQNMYGQSELVPIIATPSGAIANIVYNDNSFDKIQQSYHQKESNSHELVYQLPLSFVETPVSSENTPINSNSTDTNLEMQPNEFIFNSYKTSNSINDTNQPNLTDSNQYRIDEVPNSILDDKENYQSRSQLHPDKDQQRILDYCESTMSTLLAAVNDITAREEQFQSYLNPTKNIPNHDMDYYSSTHVENIPSPIYGNASTKDAEAECSKTITKTFNFGQIIPQELFSNGRDSPADEYVDINEMEFIEKNSEEGQRQKNILMRRSRRKKTNKRKDDELTVVDKVVPTRALASLPTSYLYFETSSDGYNKTKEIVFAKREIPLDMKFGPFVGVTKILNKHNLKKYREANAKYPLLFLSQNSILDVSDENTSNWMRFVRLATKFQDQNVLLYEINSQLYFKCSKLICPKNELRVGYSSEYAQKYNLSELSPEKIEKTVKYSSKKCTERCIGSEILRYHLDEHKSKDKGTQPVPRTTLTKNSEAILSNKSKDRLNTGAIRMRKLALSKNKRESGPTVRYACCYCTKVFSTFVSYKKHTHIIHSVNIEHKRVKVDAQHKRLTIEDSVAKKEPTKANENDNPNTKQWFVCQICQQHFLSAEKLEKHLLSNCDDKDSMNVYCNICQKNFQTPSALSMHIKMHNSTNGICKCPFCSRQYQSTLMFREHVKKHMINGCYTCPQCEKSFPKYSSVRKHIRINHTTVRFVCHECGKDFKSKYKLKEHTLSHSDFREFCCSDCDKQFKRKDKLREHILRVHATRKSPKKKKKIKNELREDASEMQSPEEVKNNESPKDGQIKSIEVEFSTYSESKACKLDEIIETEPTEPPIKTKFQPIVAPTDYERFIYKCHDCMLGFKRRGMLVNHMVKRHPNIRIESIHELNLPILKTERCFYCMYCDKEYKSSSKRKAHILKNHPGQKLPQSTRRKNDETEHSSEQNPSFSANVGSITTVAHRCMWCYKQYASRSRLLQHKRKEHSKEIEESFKKSQNDYFKELNMIMDSHESQFQTSQIQQTIDDYSIKFTEMHENETHSLHRFHNIGYEPENRLLELSSAALEASMRDDYSFLSDSDVNAMSSDMMEARVDVNFKCDSNTLPQLFEEIDCMSLKPTHFSSGTSHIDGDIGRMSFHK